MLEWILAAGVLVLGVLATIAALTHAKCHPRKSGGGGFVVALGMILASVLDPAKAAATEEIDRRRETEGSEEGESGEPPW